MKTKKLNKYIVSFSNSFLWALLFHLQILWQETGLMHLQIETMLETLQLHIYYTPECLVNVEASLYILLKFTATVKWSNNKRQ